MIQKPGSENISYPLSWIDRPALLETLPVPW
jgi:hypothetical protein